MTPEATDYAIRLDFFEGPLDLLLHLIHQQEVSVEEVEMADVAEQFLKIISHASQLDLERASEYLVIAATLLSIKSRSVLPTMSAIGDDELAGAEPGTEFYEQLRARLKMYELTQQRAMELKSRPQLGIDTFNRRVRVELPVDPDLPLDLGDANSLALAFGKMLRRIGEGVRSLRIRLEPISIVNFMMRIVDVLQPEQAQKSHKFSHLLCQLASAEAQTNGKSEELDERRDRAARIGMRNRIEQRHRGTVIGGFIAILELVRRGIISVTHGADDADFLIDLRSDHRKAEGALGQLSDAMVEQESGIRITQPLLREANSGS